MNQEGKSSLEILAEVGLRLNDHDNTMQSSMNAKQNIQTKILELFNSNETQNLNEQIVNLPQNQTTYDDLQKLKLQLILQQSKVVSPINNVNEQRLFIPKVEPEDLRDHFDRYEQEADRLRSIRTEIENMEREKKNLEIKKIEDNQKIDSEINFVDQKLKLKTDIYLRKLESQENQRHKLDQMTKLIQESQLLSPSTNLPSSFNKKLVINNQIPLKIEQNLSPLDCTQRPTTLNLDNGLIPFTSPTLMSNKISHIFEIGLNSKPTFDQKDYTFLSKTKPNNSKSSVGGSSASTISPITPGSNLSLGGHVFYKNQSPNVPDCYNSSKCNRLDIKGNSKCSSNRSTPVNFKIEHQIQTPENTIPEDSPVSTPAPTCKQYCNTWVDDHFSKSLGPEKWSKLKSIIESNEFDKVKCFSQIPENDKVDKFVDCRRPSSGPKRHSNCRRLKRPDSLGTIPYLKSRPSKNQTGPAMYNYCKSNNLDNSSIKSVDSNIIVYNKNKSSSVMSSPVKSNGRAKSLLNLRFDKRKNGNSPDFQKPVHYINVQKVLELSRLESQDIDNDLKDEMSDSEVDVCYSEKSPNFNIPKSEQTNSVKSENPSV